MTLAGFHSQGHIFTTNQDKCTIIGYILIVSDMSF